MAKVKLTTTDTALLRSYLNALDKLGESEPERLPLEAWDEIMPYVREHGEIPPAYVGRVGTNTQTDPTTGEEITGYYDLVWEEWNKEVRALHEKYHDTVVKALRFALQGGEEMAEHPQVRDLLQVLIASVESAAPAQVGDVTGELLANAYIPMLNGALTNDIMRVDARSLTPDPFTGVAKFTTDDGHVISIENYDKLTSRLGITALKLLDIATAYLTDVNYFRGRRENITPTVEIPLVEFGELCGWSLTPQVMETDEEQLQENKRVSNRLKAFRRSVRGDLSNISSVKWSATETKGRNKGDYVEMRIISSHSIRNGILRVNFDVDAAAYLVNAYIMQYPARALLQVRNVNAYGIGRKMALHNSIDNNNVRGTESTLGVTSLLAAAPNLKGIEAIKARGQRNWKDKIKRPLEAALDELVSVGLLGKWQYRDPKGTTYTADEAKALSWLQYSRLMVDYVMVDAPDQTERRAAIAEAKAKAAEAKRQGEGRKRRARGSDAGTKG